MHIVSPIFESGKVWYPSGEKFAEDVIEEVASFPNGDHDDYCDSMTMGIDLDKATLDLSSTKVALLHLKTRQEKPRGGLIEDEGEDDEVSWRRIYSITKREYY